MQHIIEEIKEHFSLFIDDEDKSVMIVEATADESMWLLKSIDILEEDEMSSDVFMVHLDSFDDSRTYVGSLFDNQEIQIEGVNEKLAERDEPLLEDLPEELSKRSIQNHERLLGIVKHIRKIVDADRKIIWVFFPLQETESGEAYTNLLRVLINVILDDKIEGTKLIIRDVPDLTLKNKLSAFDEKVSFYQPKLDLDSIFEKIEKQSKNPSAPPDERAQNLMLMAGVDVAEKRFDEALEKNETVLKYFEKSNQKQKQSVVYNNIGDVHYMRSDFSLAQESYENAISIAIDEKSQPLMIYQSINVGNSLLMQKKYDEALIYYQSAEKLAEVNQVVMQWVQALERTGDTHKAQGENDRAIESWEKAAVVCRENGFKIGMVAILEKLGNAYEEKCDTGNFKKNQQELEACKEEIRQVEPSLLDK
jgi:tetratricopeptide (TPR) repeat protein